MWYLGRGLLQIDVVLVLGFTHSPKSNSAALQNANMSSTTDSKVNMEKEAVVSDHGDTDIQTGESNTAWTPADERALVRKIDLRIFPTLIVLFILNFIDRNNFANARLYGLQEDLGLSDVQYQTCISILLVGYVSMQIPSNMFLNKISRPGWYLCGCVVVWGVISAATAAVHNATGAILCRFFLGCVEASLFPGSLYYLSRWYTSKEMAFRVTLLNAGNLLAQAFGGLVAAGVLNNMEGVKGIRAWRWLFIIEGVATVAIGYVFPTSYVFQCLVLMLLFS